MKRKKLTLKEKLFAHRKIDPITECWLWTGGLIYSSYGQLSYESKTQFVHRLAYQEFVGPIKNYILHKRNCPNKNCFNPDHLYDGTNYENRIDDLIVNDRIKNKTHCINGHSYTKENIYIMGNQRVCKICASLRAKKRYQKVLEQGKLRNLNTTLSNPTDKI